MRHGICTPARAPRVGPQRRRREAGATLIALLIAVARSAPSAPETAPRTEATEAEARRIRTAGTHLCKREESAHRHSVRRRIRGPGTESNGDGYRAGEPDGRGASNRTSSAARPVRRCDSRHARGHRRRRPEGDLADMPSLAPAAGLRSRNHARASIAMSACGPNRARSDAAGFAVPAGCREARSAASHRGHLAVDRRALACSQACGAREMARAPARRSGARARRSTALNRVLALRRMHRDVLSDPVTAVEETIGVVPASGTVTSRTRAHEHRRHPRHVVPPNHGGVSARKP